MLQARRDQRSMCFTHHTRMRMLYISNPKELRIGKAYTNQLFRQRLSLARDIRNTYILI